MLYAASLRLENGELRTGVGCTVGLVRRPMVTQQSHHSRSLWP